MQRWNELLQERFRAAGWNEVRPSYGSILVPLFEEDGLRMGELARRARLSKQTMTTMVRLLEREQLVRREQDPDDGRAFRIVLTTKARRFEPIAERTLAELCALAEGADVDGFLITPLIQPGSTTDFIEHVLPILKKRGAFRSGYEEHTLRERLMGQGSARLPDDHPGASHRHWS